MKHPAQLRQERSVHEARLYSDVPAGGARALSQQGRAAAAMQRAKLRHDVDQLAVNDVAAFVAESARGHDVVYKRPQLEDFAAAITRLADDGGRLDATGKLLARCARSPSSTDRNSSA